MISCDQCRIELAEHALGHVSAETTATVDEHLAACPVCRHESAALAATWSSMPLALPARVPPADLFDRIVNRIGDDADWRLTTPDSTAATTLAAKPANQLTRTQRILSYVLAASLFIGLTGWLFQLSRPSAADEANRAAIAKLEQDIYKFRFAEAQRLLQSERVRIVSLHGPKAPEAAKAFVLWDIGGRQWHFVTTDIPPAPAGQRYQLWVATRNGAFLPGPTFNVDAHGLGATVADFPTLSPTDGARAVVTLETTEGAKEPSKTTVLEATL